MDSPAAARVSQNSRPGLRTVIGTSPRAPHGGNPPRRLAASFASREAPALPVCDHSGVAMLLRVGDRHIDLVAPAVAAAAAAQLRLDVGEMGVAGMVGDELPQPQLARCRLAAHRRECAALPARSMASGHRY